MVLNDTKCFKWVNEMELFRVIDNIFLFPGSTLILEAALDFLKVPYQSMEVDPLTRSQIKFSKEGPLWHVWKESLCQSMSYGALIFVKETSSWFWIHIDLLASHGICTTEIFMTFSTKTGLQKGSDCSFLWWKRGGRLHQDCGQGCQFWGNTEKCRSGSNLDWNQLFSFPCCCDDYYCNYYCCRYVVVSWTSFSGGQLQGGALFERWGPERCRGWHNCLSLSGFTFVVELLLVFL